MAILIIKDRDKEFDDIFYEFDNPHTRDQAVEVIRTVIDNECGWCMEDIDEALYQFKGNCEADVQEYYI